MLNYSKQQYYLNELENNGRTGALARRVVEQSGYKKMQNTLPVPYISQKKF